MPAQSGFANDVMYAQNVRFDGASHPGQVTTDGQLLIGATVSPNIRVGTLSSTDGSVVITPGAGTIDLSAAGVNVPEDQIFYVGKHGNNANAGTNINTSVLTFGQALTLATAATPSSTNRYAIVCLDDGIYTENLVSVQYVDIYAPNAKIVGQIQITDDVHIHLRAQDVATGLIGAYKNSGTGTATYDVEDLTLAGSGIGILSHSGKLNVKFKTLTVVDGTGIGDVTLTQADVNISGGDIYITGTGNGIARNSNGFTLGHVNRIINQGAGAGKAFNLPRGDGVYMSVDYIHTTDALVLNSDFSPPSSLYLYAGFVKGDAIAYNVVDANLWLSYFQLSGTRSDPSLAASIALSVPPFGPLVDGQLIIGAGVGYNDPQTGNLLNGNNINISNGAGSITVNVTDNISLPASNTTATQGFINLGTERFIHNYGAGGNASENTFVGNNAGNSTLTGTGTTGIGGYSLWQVTSGTANTSVGYHSMLGLLTGSYNTAMGWFSSTALTSGDQNTALGFQSLVNNQTGSYNTSIGSGASSAYTTSESSNITIGSSGVAAESNTIRIGTQGSGAGQQNACYVAGINGVTIASPNLVTINTSTNQLGSQSLSSLSVQLAKITLTSAQIKGLSVSPVTLVPAQGANTIIVPVNASAIYSYGGNNPFTGGNTVELWFASSGQEIVANLMNISAMQGTANAYSYNAFNAIGAQSQASGQLDNLDVLVVAPTTAYTGNASDDNTLTINFAYYVIHL
jgi:hypothetical protein